MVKATEHRVFKAGGTINTDIRSAGGKTCQCQLTCHALGKPKKTQQQKPKRKNKSKSNSKQIKSKPKGGITEGKAKSQAKGRGKRLCKRDIGIDLLMDKRRQYAKKFGLPYNERTGCYETHK